MITFRGTTKEHSDGNEAKHSLCQELMFPTSLPMLCECKDQQDLSNFINHFAHLKMHTEFYFEQLNTIYYFEDLKLNGRILLCTDSLRSKDPETNIEKATVASK
jgi:hypothetical protein